MLSHLLIVIWNNKFSVLDSYFRVFFASSQKRLKKLEDWEEEEQEEQEEQ